jgi:hypothetical protein
MPPAATSHDPQHVADMARRDASDEARRAGEEVRSTARNMREHVRDAARDAGRIARDEANARVGRAADGAAAEAERAAAAAEEAAGDQPEGALSSRALEGVSVFLEDTAHGLRETDLESVAGEVRRFARRNPLTFLAGAAAVGFAVTRIARAGARDDAGAGRGSSRDGHGDPEPARDDRPQDAAAHRATDFGPSADGTGDETGRASTAPKNGPEGAGGT